VFRLKICSNPNPLASGVRGATYVCFGFGFGLASVGWGCVWYMVCDDMVGAGWAGKGGTG